jgi:hypothetical protein
MSFRAKIENTSFLSDVINDPIGLQKLEQSALQFLKMTLNINHSHHNDNQYDDIEHLS